MIDRALSVAALCHLSDNIYDYPGQSQGKVTVPSIDDAEDMEFCDVSKAIIYCKQISNTCSRNIKTELSKIWHFQILHQIGYRILNFKEDEIDNVDSIIFNV